MWLHLIPLYFVAVAASSYGFSVQDKATCPPKGDLKPCTCSDSGGVTVTCREITDSAALQNVFSKNRQWKLKIVHIDRCVIDFIPSALIQLKSLVTLNVSSSSMTALFEKIPEQTPEFDIFMYSTSGTFNVDIKTIGKDFKTFMPKNIKSLWFENSKTKHISNNAFERMEELELLAVTGGTLKTLVRDWFPRPWNIRFLNFGFQKITELPENFFDDMPTLILFAMENNYLKTIDIKVFTKIGATYSLGENPIVCDCDVKWITTSGISHGKKFYGTCAESLPGKKLNVLAEQDFSHCE